MKKAYRLFKDKVKNVLIVYREGTTEAEQMATELSMWFSELKIKTFSHPKQSIRVQKKKIPPLKSMARIDLVVVLGGDGTYLQAVRLLEGKHIPIIGVNLGSLGFLTAVRVEDMYATLQLVLDGQMELRRRSVLKVKLRRRNKVIKELSALNDLVLERGPHPHLIYVDVSIDSYLISSVKADGIIIASPTGSTAYNLAAGGPILHPEVNSLVVTPICPHSLTNRPLILPDHKKIVFRLREGQQRAFLTVDGKKIDEISDRDEILIERHPCDHFILRHPTHNYFDLLREKLKFGARN